MRFNKKKSKDEEKGSSTCSNSNDPTDDSKLIQNPSKKTSSDQEKGEEKETLGSAAKISRNNSRNRDISLSKRPGSGSSSSQNHGLLQQQLSSHESRGCSRKSSAQSQGGGGAISKVSEPETLSAKSKNGSKKRRNGHRFSLRRFFYGNPFLAVPFLPDSFSAPGSNFCRRKNNQKMRQSSASSATNPMMNQQPGPGPMSGYPAEPGVSWRDNSSTSSENMTRECVLCLSSFPSENFPPMLNCYHTSCIDCLQFYLKIELQEGRGNIKCPQCVVPMHPNDIASILGQKNIDLLRLYEFLMLRRLLAADPDTRWCPGPNCSFAVIATGCASCPKITCERPGCGFSFCYHCKAEWHPNITCDMARQQRQQPMMRASSVSFSQESGLHASEVKVCPRCNVLIVKMDDGSCNHMTCGVCSAEFCWLCMKEISDLHYLSPSGCTFWGKKPWSRKKKLMWQLGTLVGAPVGIALLAGISIPAMIIGIPVWVGRKIHSQYALTGKHKRNLAIAGGVVSSIIISPVLAGLAVSIGVPILLAYVYGVVPISLCRSEGCGVSTSGSGVGVDIDEEMPYRPNATSSHQVTNPSIGEVSLGASLSLGSACHLEERGLEVSSTAGDRESASNTAIAGTSRTVSVASSYRMNPCLKSDLVRLEVDVHSRKKLSLSTERLSETVSLSERSATVSLADNDGSASTRALAGSLLAYRLGDSQSVGSYRIPGDSGYPGERHGMVSGDEISLKSLPSGGNNANVTSIVSSNNQRSFSPISQMSAGEDAISRRSVRKGRPYLDKQLSENSSLLSTEDATSERVRFDDNVSFIDERGVGPSASIINTNDDKDNNATTTTNTSSDPGVNFSAKIHKPSKLETPRSLPEETPEELALVISPEPKRNLTIVPTSSSSSATSCKDNITTLKIGQCSAEETTQEKQQQIFGHPQNNVLSSNMDGKIEIKIKNSYT